MSYRTALQGLRRLGVSGAIRVLKKAYAIEKEDPTDLPPRKRLRAWQHGFTSSSYLLYDLDHNDPKDFLPDAVRHLITPIEGAYGRILRDKLFSTLVLQAYVKVPEVVAIVARGNLSPFGAGSKVKDLNTLLEYCETESSVIIKPCDSGEGRRITKVEIKGQALYLNNKQAEKRELETLISGIDNYVVTAVVEQAGYARTIFPHTANTLRVITMPDTENDHRPFIAAAVHRFGALESIPVDNTARGGLVAKIDLDTGKMSSAKKHPARGEQEFTRHPETDVQIEGVEVPHWQEVKEGLLQMVAALPFVKFVGWDVVVTEEGFCILEGNNPPSLAIQGWYPFFQDPRIRRFFEYYKVIK